MMRHFVQIKNRNYLENTENDSGIYTPLNVEQERELNSATNGSKSYNKIQRNVETEKKSAEAPPLEQSEEATVRLIKLRKTATDETYGFHLTRTKWDPYPWVRAIDTNSPADIFGLKAGDCILEVNGEDVLGMSIKDIADLAIANNVTLLLWRSDWNYKCEKENLCCGPMPITLERLSVIVQEILSIIECPVCLDTIAPPAMQCQNGHLLCVKCRILAEKCPVCRDRYTPRRALIAEQIYTAITNAFNLCCNEDKLRLKLFEEKTKQQRFSVYKKKAADGGGGKERKEIKEKNKFLTKLLFRKAKSMENLSHAIAMTCQAAATTTTVTKSTQTLTTTNCDGSLTVSSTPISSNTSLSALPLVTPTPTPTTTKTISPSKCTSSNQVYYTINNIANHINFKDDAASKAKPDDVYTRAAATTTTTTTKKTILSPTTIATNKVASANGISKYFSLSSNDLSQELVQSHQQIQKESKQHTLTSLNYTPLNKTTITTYNSSLQKLTSNKANCKQHNSFELDSKSIATAATTPSPLSLSSSSPPPPLAYLARRRPCCCILLQKQNDFNNNNIDSDNNFNSIQCIRKRFLPTTTTKSNIDVVDNSTTTSSIVIAKNVLAASASATNCTNTNKFNTSTTSVNPKTKLAETATIKNELLSPMVLEQVTANSMLSSSSSSSADPRTNLSRFTHTSAETVTLSSPTMAAAAVLTPSFAAASSNDTKAPVVNTTDCSSLKMMLESPPASPFSSSSSSPPPSQCYEQLNLLQQKNHVRYRCPCNCEKVFNASTELQRHVKVKHRLPILSVGYASAQLALPLRQPVDNMVLILEIKSSAIVAGASKENSDNNKAAANDDDDENVRSDDKAMNMNKECWIRIKMHGDECIQTTAVLQAATEESVDFIMKTRLNRNKSDGNGDHDDEEMK